MSGENRCVLWDHDISGFLKEDDLLMLQRSRSGVLDAWCPSQVEWKVPLTAHTGTGPPFGVQGHTVLLIPWSLQTLSASPPGDDSLMRQSVG